MFNVLREWVSRIWSQGKPADPFKPANSNTPKVLDIPAVRRAQRVGR